MALSFASIQHELSAAAPDIPLEAFSLIYGAFFTDDGTMASISPFLALMGYVGVNARTSCREYLERNGTLYEKNSDGSILVSRKDLRALLQTKGGKEVEQFLEMFFEFAPLCTLKAAEVVNLVQHGEEDLADRLAACLNKRKRDEESLESVTDQLALVYRADKEHSDAMNKDLMSLEWAEDPEREGGNLSVALKQSHSEKEDLEMRLVAVSAESSALEQLWGDAADDYEEYYLLVNDAEIENEEEIGELKKRLNVWTKYGCQEGVFLDSIKRVYELSEPVKDKAKEIKCAAAWIADIKERGADAEAREKAYRAYGDLLVEKANLVDAVDDQHIVSQNYVINYLQERVKALKGEWEELQRKVEAGLVSFSEMWDGPPKMSPKARGELIDLMRYGLRTRLGLGDHVFEDPLLNEVYLFGLDRQWASRMMRTFRRASGKAPVKPSDLPDDAFPCVDFERLAKFQPMAAPDAELAEFFPAV